MKKLVLLIILQFFLVNLSAHANISSWHDEKNNNAQIRSLISFYQDKNSQKIDYSKPIIGLEFKIKKGWKIYGHGADSVGIEPKLDFSGQNNYQSHVISWPYPIKESETFDNITYEYYTYKDHVILPIELNLKEEIKENQVIKFRLDYGLCKDVCIPASQEFAIELDKAIDENALKLIQNYYDKPIIDIKAEITSNKTHNNSKNSILFMLLIGVIGGAILNIMPCVLPVLSIKLISIINHSSAKISKIRFAFLSTILGILSCFLIFAILAIIIKFSGNSLGWGLQFQNPYFLVFLIIILIFFIANMLGVYEINLGQTIVNLLNKEISDKENSQRVFITNYLSGILAVLLATPCSAPFLGSAISFALIQDYLVIIAMFFAIGFGFALPYVILFFAPKLVYLLPKPGNWMHNLKQVMAGFLMATVIWLIYVLMGIIGHLPAFIISFLAIALIACIRLKSALLRYISTTIIAIILFSLPFSIKHDSDKRVKQYNAIWKNFEESKIQKYVKENKVVVVDVTADWCITCKFNKYRVLQNKEVLKILQDPKIIALKADITKPDKEVMKFLEKHGRYAIPFNAVFGPYAPNGILTSELLTKEELLAAINKARYGK